MLNGVHLATTSNGNVIEFRIRSYSGMDNASSARNWGDSTEITGSIYIVEPGLAWLRNARRIGDRDRGVIGAVDRHHDSTGGAVSTADHEAFGRGRTLWQRLYIGGAVVQGVRPYACTGDAEAAVSAGRARLRHKAGLVGIRVADGKCASGRGGAVFRDRAGQWTADRRGVVGALDGYRQGGAGGAAIAVTDGVGERVGDVLTCG